MPRKSRSGTLLGGVHQGLAATAADLDDERRSPAEDRARIEDVRRVDRRARSRAREVEDVRGGELVPRALLTRVQPSAAAGEGHRFDPVLRGFHGR
jgi:hypothetical protein